MVPRSLLTLPVALLGLLLATTCSQNQTPPVQKADAGKVEVDCETGDDCSAGDCIGGLCLWCEDGTCPAGQWCSHNGKCVGCDGGCEVDAAAPVADAGTACASRADCNGLACIDEVCAKQGATCQKSDECEAGSICNASGACVVGCGSKADCAGAAAGPRCDLATGQCGPCVDTADCNAATQNCVAGVCTAAVACPDGDRGPCGELACVEKVCRACAAGTDCGPGFDCAAGKCVGKTSCTTDDQCHTLTAGHWCDTASGLCKWGCLTMPCGSNCCTGGLSCNTTTHVCEKVACNNCGGSCLPTQTCDTVSCVCVAGAGCNALDCSCAAGLTCKCSGLLGCIPGACNTTGKCQ